MNLSIDSLPRRLIIALLVGVAFLFTSSANALGFAESIESMVARADLIFIGTLKEIKSFKFKFVDHPYGGERKNEGVETTELVSDSVFKIDKILKGVFSDETVAIRQAGGMNGGLLILPSIAYTPYLEKQYIVIAVKSDLFNGVLVTTSGGQGILEKYERDGIVYLRNLERDTVIIKEGDPNSQIDHDVTLDHFLKIVGGKEK